MPTVKDDLARLKKEFFEEAGSIGVEDFRRNSHQISVCLSSLIPQQLINYKKEFGLARKAGLLEVTYSDGDWRNTEYNMKGIPHETLVRDYC
jgi:hypothetical protein